MFRARRFEVAGLMRRNEEHADRVEIQPALIADQSTMLAT